MSDLMPCPFCGKPPRVFLDQVGCADKKCAGSMVLCWPQHWNTRQPAPSGNGWLPIESAPKDGTQILGRVDYTDQTWTVVYFGGFHPNSPGKHVWRDAFSKRPVQSFEAWMPLPPAPGEAAESVPAECAVCNYIQAGCAIPSDIGHTCKPAATKENHNEL